MKWEDWNPAEWNSGMRGFILLAIIMAAAAVIPLLLVDLLLRTLT